MNDPRLGNTETGEEPRVCAVSLLPLRSNTIRYALQDGYFFRVRASRQHLLTDAHIKELQNLISKPARKSKKQDDES